METAAAIELLLALINNAGQISALIQKAQGEGRDKLTPEEWASITGADDSASASLKAAIEKAKGEGR